MLPVPYDWGRNISAFPAWINESVFSELSMGIELLSIIVLLL